MHKKGKKMKIKYSKSNVRMKTRFLFHTRRQKTVGLILHARLRKAEDKSFQLKILFCSLLLLPFIRSHRNEFPPRWRKFQVRTFY